MTHFRNFIVICLIFLLTPKFLYADDLFDMIDNNDRQEQKELADQKRKIENERKKRAIREENERKAQEEKDRRDAEYRRAHACDNLYQGKKVTVSKKYGTSLLFAAGTNYYDAIVLGFSSKSGQATVRRTDDGSTHEVSCETMQIY